MIDNSKHIITQSTKEYILSTLFSGNQLANKLFYVDKKWLDGLCDKLLTACYADAEFNAIFENNESDYFKMMKLAHQYIAVKFNDTILVNIQNSVNNITDFLSLNSYTLSLEIGKNIRNYLDPGIWNLEKPEITKFIEAIENDPSDLLSESGLTRYDWLEGYKSGYLKSYVLKRTEHLGVIPVVDEVYNLYSLQSRITISNVLDLDGNLVVNSSKHLLPLIESLDKQNLYYSFIKNGLSCLYEYVSMFED